MRVLVPYSYTGKDGLLLPKGETILRFLERRLDRGVWTLWVAVRKGRLLTKTALRSLRPTETSCACCGTKSN
jgi:hypothetical protein